MTALPEEEKKCLVVVRIRGNVGTTREMEEAFRLLHLIRKNHAAILPSSPSNVGALRKVKDYATWGEASLETVTELLVKRGRLSGNRKLTEEYVKSYLGYESIADLAKSIQEAKADMRLLKGVKPLFRLSPPSKGFSASTKKPYPGGALGYRGEEINTLLSRMA
jgi:large subunit ribosomal protein L30